MKPDKTDIKIQEAAAQNEPACDEVAWGVMEKLLDEEMPQKKRDRRKIFWVILLLFLAAAGTFMIFNPWQIRSKEIAAKQTYEYKTPGNSGDNALIRNKTINNIKINKKIVASQNVVKSEANKGSFQQRTVRKKIENDKLTNTSVKTIITGDDNGFHQEIALSGKSDETAQLPRPKSRKENGPLTLPEKKNEAVMTSNEKMISNTIKDNAKATPKKNTPPPTRNRFGNSFVINLSIGPDVSALKIKNIGKVEPAYGGGVGYKINKTITVQTGFYVERKVYDAAPYDYHPPVAFWIYYPDLKYIDADCKIYEVPLAVTFNYAKSLKHLWFGSMGVSSYFMKKEDYDYLSKSPSGQISYNSYYIKNKNQNYFSSVKLSAGYEEKLSTGISVVAEPYVNFPLSGVGYGKVKLYSAGILFSIEVKPFSKK